MTIHLEATKLIAATNRKAFIRSTVHKKGIEAKRTLGYLCSPACMTLLNGMENGVIISPEAGDYIQESSRDETRQGGVAPTRIC